MGLFLTNKLPTPSAQRKLSYFDQLKKRFRLELFSVDLRDLKLSQSRRVKIKHLRKRSALNPAESIRHAHGQPRDRETDRTVVDRASL